MKQTYKLVHPPSSANLLERQVEMTLRGSEGWIFCGVNAYGSEVFRKPTSEAVGSSPALYQCNINEDACQAVVGKPYMTADETILAISEFRKIQENIHRPIQIIDMAGKVLVDENRE